MSSVPSQVSRTEEGLSHVAVSTGPTGPLASVISVLGLLAATAWVGWRFPTLTRLAGRCFWVLAWACGSQGGHGYRAAFVVLGALTWGAGTIWYAKRRGRWPSMLSGRILSRALAPRSPLPRTARQTSLIGLLRQQ